MYGLWNLGNDGSFGHGPFNFLKKFVLCVKQVKVHVDRIWKASNDITALFIYLCSRDTHHIHQTPHNYSL